MNKSEFVYINDVLTGTLEVDDYGMLLFKYDSDYTQRKNAIPLSSSLPLQEQQYSGGAAQAFFVGLLPEETELKQIAQSMGTDSSNSFRLLQEIGKECVGAVRIGGATKKTPSEYQPITASEWEAIVQNNLHRVSYLYKDKKQRLSLAGAQSKMGVLFQDDQYYFAQNSSPTNCIVKFPSDRFPNSIENEFVTMTLAGWLGIDVPDIQLIQLGGKNCYTINRFDRDTTSGQLQRIHQEDFCQAMGIHTQNKYEQDGGPSFSTCIQLIRKVCSVPVIAINTFINLFIFNILIGNRDAHGKNFSLLYQNGQVILSPAYDLVCTAFYKELADNMAMKVGKQYDDEFLTAADFELALSNAGISYGQFQRKMQSQITLLEEKIGEIISLDIDAEFAQEFIGLIQERLKHFKSI
jgi:serine/threonine-protein kinase HipA